MGIDIGVVGNFEDGDFFGPMPNMGSESER